MSLCLWAFAAWALQTPDKQLIHQLILGVAALTLLVHIVEVAVLFTHSKLKAHATAKNAALTLLMGAFHFMPIYKQATR